MKTALNMAAQGDVLFRKIKLSNVPKTARDITPDNGKLVVAHSDTGHDHVASGKLARLLAGDDPMICYLQASDNILVEQLRSFDTHETIELACTLGEVWEVRRQREWVPEGWRRVED